MKRFVACCVILACIFGMVGCGVKAPGKPKLKASAYGKEMSKEELDAIARKACEAASKDAERAARAGAPWAIAAESALAVSNRPHAIIETNKGKIDIALFSEKSPKTVANFIKLADKGFFNDMKWTALTGHLIVSGDPNSKSKNSSNDGVAAPGDRIKAEPYMRPNVAGSVGMVHGKDPNSGGSQFYICVQPEPALDGKFTIFGLVTEGMNVVAQIADFDMITKVYIQEKQSE